MGAELELIPVRASTGQRVAITGQPGAPGMADLINSAAAETGWTETRDAYNAPAWNIPGGGRITFEPGGQIEISSPVYMAPGPLIGFLDTVVRQLRRYAGMHDVELLAVGVDPNNLIAAVPQQLHAPRYDLMARHFDSIGPAGIRMMRQTASLQINVELGPEPLRRWRLLNALAPYLTAAFANSRMYAGADTGSASYRAVLWQELDSTRTGMVYSSSDPVGAYARFADRATRILDDDAAHLTTLFPEVRPRGYFEIRSIDAVEVERAAQAIRFISAVTLDPNATNAALELLGDPDPALLAVSARLGRADPRMDATITALGSIAGIAI